MEFEMKRKQFQKSLLALMVGAISTQALAVEFDLGQGKNIWVGETFNESLIINGTFSEVVVPTTTNPAGLGVANTTIQGSLINRADITLDSQGAAIRAIALDPLFWSGPQNLSRELSPGTWSRRATFL